MQLLKRKNQKIVNEDGENILLQGYAAGNWMVQEAFLFGTGAFHGEFKPFMRSVGMDRPRTINQILIETCGHAYAVDFWHRYYRNYLQESDIVHLKEEGFNSIRLPLLANAFLKEEPEIEWDEENLQMLDELIGWCDKHEVYVILDMHAAVSGQSTVGCDDGVDNYPHLFTDAEGRERTILVWKKLAARYSSCNAVAGYELLNEPLALPRWDNLIPELLSFYRDCIDEIRSVDTRHMIFLQGHRFAKRGDIFNEDMDPISHNWVLTFHIYETLPDLGLLGPMLSDRERLNVPIWIGETGGSAHWMTVLFSMLRECNVGFNVWCHKAVDRPNAPTLLTYEVPEDFKEITAYALEGGSKPSYQKSMQIFNSYLENVKFENCMVHKTPVSAALRKVPVTVPAIGYDFAFTSHHGEYPYCSFSGYRREDHLQMRLGKGESPYEQAEFKNISFEKIPKYGDYNRLQLVLHTDEYVSYSFPRQSVPVEIRLVGDLSKVELSITCADHVYTNADVIHVDANIPFTIRITCREGEAVLKEIQCISENGKA